MVAPATVPGILLTGIHSARPSTASAGALYSCTTHGLVYQSDGAGTWTTWATLGITGIGSLTGIVEPVEFVIDGGGSALTTGIKGYLSIPFAWSDISSAILLADVSGSVVVDIFKCTYSAFDPATHPASGDKITASAPPTISSAKKSSDSTLTGWTKTGSAGDILAFNVNSATTITRVTAILNLVRS
jgi:hypothetical protein